MNSTRIVPLLTLLIALGTCIEMQAQFNMVAGTVDNVCGQLFRDDAGSGPYTGDEIVMPSDVVHTARA